MNPTFRSILAVIAGIITFVVTISLIEGINLAIYPPPDGFDWKNEEDVRQMMRELPDGAYLIVLIGWGSGAFVGAAMAGWVAGRRQLLHASIIGGFGFLSTLANVRLLPFHPDWMVWSGLLLPIPVSLLAGMLISPRPSAPAKTSANKGKK